MSRIYLFQPATTSSIPASTIQLIVSKSQSIPISGMTTLKIMQAFTALSPNDATGNISLLALELGYQLQDNTGKALFTEPLPVSYTPNLALPKSTGNGFIFVATPAPADVEVNVTDILGGVSGALSQVILISEALVSNADSVSAHSASISVGGVVEFE